MKFSIIDNETFFKAMENQWNDLCTRSAHTYFQRFSWLMIWWVYRGRPKQARLNIIIAEDKDKLVFAWPLVVEKEKFWNTLKWMGSDVSDYCDVIIDDALDSPLEVVKDAWESLKKVPGVDLIQLDKIRSDSTILPFVKQTGWFSKLSNTSPYIRIDQWQDWETYFNQFKKNLQVKTHRRRLKALAKKGKPCFTINKTVQMDETLKLLINQKVARLVQKGQTGIQEKEWFSEFILDVIQSAGQDDTLHLAVLSVDQNIIACHLGFYYQDTLYWYIPTFDPAWGKFSPGRMILEELLKWCFKNKIKTFDFLVGDETYKYHWTNQDVKIHSAATFFSFKGYLICRWLSGRLKPFIKKRYDSLPGDLKRKIASYLK